MGADDSIRKLKGKKNAKKKREENPGMGNSQIAEIEEDFFIASKKKKSKKSSDVIANKAEVKMLGLSNIKANKTSEINGGNKKLKKLRTKKRKTGKIAETGIDESDMPDSNEVEDKTSGKKDVSNEAREVKMLGLSNIKANKTSEINGGNKKLKKLRTKKRKTGKIAETGVDESDMPDSNEVEDKTSGKKDVSNEAREDRSQNSRKKKRKNMESVRRAAVSNEEEDISGQQNGDAMACATQSKPVDHITSSEGLDEDDTRRCKTGKSEKMARKRKKMQLLPVNDMSQDNVLEKSGEAAEYEADQMSSGDEDCSKGMKKWILQYHQSRPGIKVLQERIDDFIAAHEAQEEKARKEREAQAAEGGWTVVVHHKGRKKTTDAESGIAVGSVAQAAVLDKMAKKKNKEGDLDFYRFQRREAHRNEIMMLQSKFEQDKKRIQQMRAARKFRPY